jgi:hypothetical protein
MDLDVTEQEYLDAVTEACRIVDQCQSDPAVPRSLQDDTIKRFISAIYDPIVPCSAIGILGFSDLSRKALLLTLLVGRCKYGRPRHERADDMLAWVHECMKDDQVL